MRGVSSTSRASNVRVCDCGGADRYRESGSDLCPLCISVICAEFAYAALHPSAYARWWRAIMACTQKALATTVAT